MVERPELGTGRVGGTEWGKSSFFGQEVFVRTTDPFGNVTKDINDKFPGSVERSPEVNIVSGGLKVAGIGVAGGATAVPDGVKFEVDVGAVLGFKANVVVNGLNPFGWDWGGDITVSLETGVGAGLAGAGVGAEVGVSVSLITCEAESGWSIDTGFVGRGNGSSWDLCEKDDGELGLWLDKVVEDNIRRRAVDKAINGLEMDPEEKQALQRILKDVENQTGGPRGTGYDLNDPRGPWQIPAATGDRTGKAGGPIEQIIKTGTNIASSAVEIAVNVFERAQDAAVAAYQREYNRDRQDGGGGRPSGDSAADRASQSQSQSRSHNQEYNRDRQESAADRASHSQSQSQSQSRSHNQEYDRDRQGGKPPERVDKQGRKESDPKFSGPQPVLLDLDGNGVKITEYQNSTQFMTGKDGFQHRSSWAGAGDGVLFYDPDGRNAITEQRQYVFTEWNPTAAGDLEALRSIWDTNGDGKLSAADAEFAKFKVMVTNADGSTTVMTLAALGITEINLTANTVNIQLPDGSVITGQTTFTRANGTVGTVANTTLTADAAGYRVVESVFVNVANERVLTQTGYGADGGVAFRVISVTNPAGTASLRFYDNNGDGVTDRVQRIDRVVNDDGSKVETVVNRLGADWTVGILTSRTVTTTSADGKVITIQRDSVGGGWFDQREVWTTNADGSRTEVLQELAQNGAVIHGRSETVSANGLQRSEGTDRDGNGVAETVESHQIVIAANLSRTEVTEIRNGDGSLRAGETEAVSADGKVRTVALDLDGNGTVDRTDQMAITGAAGTATTSVATVRNGDGSTRSVTKVVQSADALTKTASADVDGDGDIDLVTVDQTVIAADGARVRTVTATNTDGSVRSLMRETLGADRATAETWVDQNQDGVFQATDLVRQVRVGVGQARTETTWARNPDGSVRATSVAVTSADGLTTNSTVDADGDGDTDTAVSDITTVAAGVATRTVQMVNQDGGLRSREVTVTSADGLTVTRTVDIDGTGTIDVQTVDARVLGGDGSVTRTVSEYAGNGTVLTGRSVRVESADRRTVTVTTDANGDGATDRVVTSVEAADGSKTVTDTSFLPVGAIAARTVTTTSANGLVSSTTVDANGDLVSETVATNTTVLNMNGSRVQAMDVNNGDGTNRTLSVTTISDDGLVVTAQSDLNGDNLFDRTSNATTVLNANGSATETSQLRAQNTALLSQVQVTVSDDGLVTTTRSDADGDGDFDLVTTATLTLLNDGGRRVVNVAAASDGSDTYVWAKGDGNDTINDWGQSLLETDTLELTDVTSTEVTLTAAGTDLRVTIVPTGEVILIDERYQNVGFGYGVERIRFSDGVTWNLNDILRQAGINGDAAANTLTGTAYQDNLYGLDGNDVLNGGDGNDMLVGGAGNDALNGGIGSDTYVWTKGDGNDTIGDTGALATDVDVLYLTNATAGDVDLYRQSGSNNLRVAVATGPGTSSEILVTDHFLNPASGVGIVVSNAAADRIELDATANAISVGRRLGLLKRQHFRLQQLQLDRHQQTIFCPARAQPDEAFARDEHLARHHRLQAVEIGHPRSPSRRISRPAVGTRSGSTSPRRAVASNAESRACSAVRMVSRGVGMIPLSSSRRGA